MPEVGNTADTPNQSSRGNTQGGFGVSAVLQRGNTQGGFGVSAVLPTSGTQTYIKNNNLPFSNCLITSNSELKTALTIWMRVRLTIYWHYEWCLEILSNLHKFSSDCNLKEFSNITRLVV